MTTREKLLLMDDIRRKNDIAWSKYAHNPRPGWTWGSPQKQPFSIRDSFGAMCMLAICIPALLVLFVMMAA